MCDRLRAVGVSARSRVVLFAESVSLPRAARYLFDGRKYRIPRPRPGSSYWSPVYQCQAISSRNSLCRLRITGALGTSLIAGRAREGDAHRGRPPLVLAGRVVPITIRRNAGASGLSTVIKDHLAGGACRLAASLGSAICASFSVDSGFAGTAARREDASGAGDRSGIQRPCGAPVVASIQMVQTRCRADRADHRHHLSH